MDTNLQAFYKHFYIGCLKTQKQQLHLVKIQNNFKIKNNFYFYFFIRAGRCVNLAGRKTVRAGRSGLGNRPPSWNTDLSQQSHGRADPSMTSIAASRSSDVTTGRLSDRCMHTSCSSNSWTASWTDVGGPSTVDISSQTASRTCVATSHRVRSDSQLCARLVENAEAKQRTLIIIIIILRLFIQRV